VEYTFSYGYAGEKHGVQVVCRENSTLFRVLADDSDAGFYVDFSLKAPICDTYIMLPACAYDGNRFESVLRRYPPMFTEEEFGLDVPVRMTGVPRLAPEGDSFMDVTTGDLAAPFVCVYDRAGGEGFIMRTAQGSHGLNFGISLEQKGDMLNIRLRAPAKRRLVYRWYEGKPSLRENPEADTPLYVMAGDEVVIPHEIHTFPCEGITGLYKRFFELRRKHTETSYAACLPFSAYWSMAEKLMNEHNYIEDESFYRLPSHGDKQWQAGWVGGGMYTLPLICDGSGESVKRAIDTLMFAAKYQSPKGWYYGIVHEGEIIHDCFRHHGDKHSLTMVRKHADLAYFMWKQIAAMAHMGIFYPTEIVKSATQATDVMVDIWRRYGQLGQFVNAETGEIKVGNSTAGAIAPAAMCAGYRISGNTLYLRAATEIGEYYHRTATLTGVTNGGPGEILSAPDSESAAALLESYVELYETTDDAKWLAYAEEAAHQLASWVVNYNYEFPAGCKFDRLGVKATGSVWANVQNKHSAPGLCTLSPAALFKLFRATDNRAYLELMRDIARFMPQVVSTENRPVYRTDGVALMPGEMCERVNLSDWEGLEGIGDSIFGSSSWPEVSLMLTWLEIPGIYVDPEKEIVCVSDHVEAHLESGRLIIENNTGYDADVKIMKETDCAQKLGLWWQDRFVRINVPAGGIAEVAAE